MDSKTAKWVPSTNCHHCGKPLNDPTLHDLTNEPGRQCVRRVWLPASDPASELVKTDPLRAEAIRSDLDGGAIIPIARGGSPPIKFTTVTEGNAEYACIKWVAEFNGKACRYSLTWDGKILELQGCIADGNSWCNFTTDAPLVLRPLVILLWSVIPRVMKQSGIKAPYTDLKRFYYDYQDQSTCVISLHACAMTQYNAIPTAPWEVSGLHLHIHKVDPIESDRLKCNTATSDALHRIHELYLAYRRGSD